MRLSNSSGRAARLHSGAVALAVVLAACSSDSAGPAHEPPVAIGSPSEPFEAPQSSTTSKTTTSTNTTTTTTDPRSVVDTEPSESSEPAPNTMVSNPLPAPTSTTFDPSTPSGEVERVVLANLSSFVTCLDELPTCDVEKATANARLAYGDGNARLMNEWNAAGYEARDTADYNFRVDEVELFAEDTEALVIACIWGGTQLVTPATDTSPEIVVDGEYTSSINRYLVRKIGDRWFLTANDPLQKSVGAEENICV